MNDQTVTILMPCAGNGIYFEEAYLSALKQTHSNFNLLVLDNASPVDLYEKTTIKHPDKRVRYIRFEDRLSLPENWQRCLSFAGDGCFCFLHDDDIWHENYLSSSIEKLCSGSSPDVVIGWNILFSDPSEICPEPLPSTKWLEFAAAGNDKKAAMLVLDDWGHMSALLFRRRIYDFDINSVWNLDQRYVHAYAMSGRLECSMSAPVWIRSHSANASALAKSVRNLRERDGFAKRELVSRMDTKFFREAIHSAALTNSTSAYRLAKAVYSWPIDPMLVSWASGIFNDNEVMRLIRSHSVKGKLMGVPGMMPKILASLLIDAILLWKARRLFDSRG